MMKIIGFCGLPGSGKSTAMESIKDLGLVITMGDVIRNEAKKMGIESTANNLGKIAKELREKEGPGAVARKCIELIQTLEDETIFIDGVRSCKEISEFRKVWKFPLIAIELNTQERFTRLYERARSDDPKVFEDLKQRDEREFSFGLKEVIEKADYKIINESTIQDLKKKTKKLVKEILKNY
ncbi:MAG: flagellar hook-basal body complex protein FliE [Promethearchaeota archaeon]|nr:MAG: flagellar hook-basal body complex protein FliE [Candidatus Lokiarchaeota archaeon]